MVCRTAPLPVLVLVLVLAAPTLGHAAPGVFVEDDVVVLAQLEGAAGAGLFGWAVSEVADVDGDQIVEAFTSAPFNTLAGDKAGAIYLYSGADRSLIFTAVGETNDLLGYGIADAGDVDGDGIPDVIAGAPGKGKGRALVYSGADASILYVFVGDTVGGGFGSAVARAGDVDGDGHSDLLVGAPAESSGGPSAGRVSVFAGVDGSRLWTRDGAPGVGLGGGTAPLADVDDDGVPDLVVGAPGSGGGAVYVLSGVDGADVYPPLAADPSGGVLGQFFVGSLGDVDGDGVADIYGGDYGDNSGGPQSGKAYVWSGLSGERLYTLDDGAAGDGCGCGRRAGDADQDGIPDIAVGCYSATAAGVAQAGYVAIFAGSDGALLRTIHGTTAGEQLGFDVVTLGDVDGDGHDDLLVAGANDNRIYVLGGALAGPDPTTGSDADTSGDPSASATGSESMTTDGSTGALTTGGGESSTSAAATSAGGSGTPTDEGSCACVAAADPPGAPALGLLALLGLAFLGLARRRRPGPR